MQKIKYYLIVFLLIASACKDGDNPAPATKEPDTSSVIPVKVTLPEAVFTETDKVSQRISSTAIMDKLIGLVDATPEKATIYVSIFGFDYPALVNALIRASQRGVKLHIMADMSSEDTQKENAGTISKLRGSLNGNAEVVVVTNDAGDIAINHNKFALFSEVITEAGKEENVVFQTSHNWTVADTRKVQDAVVLSHEGLYQAYATYWNDMSERAEKDMKYFSYREYLDPASGINAYFLPKRKYGEFYGDDTITEILDNISDPSTVTIRIGMSGWTDTRMNIVEKLDELMKQGAKVEVISKPGIGDNIYNGLMELEKKGAYIKIYSTTNIHSKFMLIEGSQGGVKYDVVVTGCQNFTRNALRYNNEVTLEFKNSELYKSYDTLFKELKALP